MYHVSAQGIDERMINVHYYYYYYYSDTSDDDTDSTENITALLPPKSCPPLSVVPGWRLEWWTETLFEKEEEEWPLLLGVDTQAHY